MDTVSDFTCGASIATGGADDEARGARPAAAPLPCLSSHNSIEKESGWNVLTGSHKRSGEVLKLEVVGLTKDFGIERVGLFTLTFADHVTDIREAQARFNSLNTNVLKKRFIRGAAVWERQASRRIHFHLAVALKSDIRTGIDFAALSRRDYRSANAALRSEWAFWRKTGPKYRFGRSELLPVKSTAAAVGFYMGKYVSICVNSRSDEDKGARIVRYFGYKLGDRKARASFGWNTEGAWAWRQKVKALAASVGCADTDALKKKFGPRWCYALQQCIMATEIEEGTVFPSSEAVDRESMTKVKNLISREQLEALSRRIPKRAKRSVGDRSDNDFKLPEGMRSDGRRSRFELLRLYDSELGETVTHVVPASMDREPW